MLKWSERFQLMFVKENLFIRMWIVLHEMKWNCWQVCMSHCNNGFWNLLNFYSSRPNQMGNVTGNVEKLPSHHVETSVSFRPKGLIICHFFLSLKTKAVCVLIILYELIQQFLLLDGYFYQMFCSLIHCFSRSGVPKLLNISTHFF